MGMLGQFRPYFDEHIVPGGAYITSLRERQNLLRQTKSDYRGKKRGMPGQMI